VKKKGVVYTPHYWAEWAVETYGIAESWMNGALILDPGCGRGSLSTAIISRALRAGFSPAPEDWARLNCIDRDEEALAVFRQLFPELTVRTSDYLLESPGVKADIIFSNPPWISFGDLDEKDKELYKPVFRSSGLTPDAKSLLLGGSRIDLAALFVVTAMNRDCAASGEGHFFLPTSLFRSESAHSAFRQLKLPGGRRFALKEIRDLGGGEPFPGAGTAYCMASYKAEETQYWPVSWLKAAPHGEWEKMEAEPADGPESPLLPRPAGSPRISPPRIHVPEGTVPRQGVNCQGASGVFHLSEIGEEQDGRIPVRSKGGYRGFLPSELVFPLMSTGSFSHSEESIPDRWIFMPYGKNGKILTPEELENFPDALEWLERHRTVLEQRRGMMLKKLMGKGLYWALIGVGPYTFAPWKLAWESYGRKRFTPKLFHSGNGVHWQGNQALHAYLPFADKTAASEALKDLTSPDLEDYLKRLGGAGTKNWAQPGRIRRLLISSAQ